jgi:hypothetical protein
LLDNNYFTVESYIFLKINYRREKMNNLVNLGIVCAYVGVLLAGVGFLLAGRCVLKWSELKEKMTLTKQT